MEFLPVKWAVIKAYKTSKASIFNYIETSEMYLIRLADDSFQLECSLLKNGDNAADILDFETGYKAGANIPQAPLVRITTNKLGRKLHDRYITIVTASQDNFDNTDWQDNSYNDITYVMRDINKQITTDNALAKETWIMFEPPFDYEIAQGAIDVPTTLAGDENAWEIHTIAVPDVPKLYGGTIELIANPRLKWKKGKELTIDAKMNPAELKYSATNHTNKILVVFKHPIGAQTEFQINIKMFK